MARISLLFTLTIVLAISSVLSHPPPSQEKSTQKILCPPMLSGLQSFPHLQIEEFLEKTAKSAPNTPQFQAFWAMCKAFDDQLADFRMTSAKEVVGSAKAKYDLVSKAFLQAQQFFGIGAASEFAVNLKKNFEKMAANYGIVIEKVGKFSAKYKDDTAAKISEIDRAEMDKCIVQLKGSIRVFLNMVMDKKMSFSKSSDSVMDPIGSFGVIGKKSLDHGSNLVMDKKMSFSKSSHSDSVMDPIGSFGVIGKKSLDHGSNLVMDKKMSFSKSSHSDSVMDPIGSFGVIGKKSLDHGSNVIMDKKMSFSKSSHSDSVMDPIGSFGVIGKKSLDHGSNVIMDKKMSFSKSSDPVMDPIGSSGVIDKKGLDHGSSYMVGGYKDLGGEDGVVYVATKMHKSTKPVGE